eukprot:gene8908-biopygen10486
MQFGIEKCGVIIMKRGKMVTCDGIELPDGEKIKGVDEEGYKYLGIVELDGIKEKEMKERFAKEYKRRIKLLLEKRRFIGIKLEQQECHFSNEYLGSCCDEIWGCDNEMDKRGTGETRQTDTENYDNEWSVTSKN